MYEYQQMADETANDIADAYIRATKYINSEVEKIFRTYSINCGINEDEARELLNNLPDDIRLNDLKAIVNEIKDPKERQDLINIINSPAYSYRIRRLEELQSDIDEQTKSLADFEQNTTKTHYVDLADYAYNRAIFDIQHGTGIGFPFNKMSKSRVNQILRQNWSGKLFSERIWGKTDEINKVLKEELLTGFMTGRPYDKTAAEIESRMAVGAMEARRLVRTESTYIANSAEMESYSECNTEEYRFVATLDIKTSAVCASLDGKKFKVKDAIPGTNMPPMHPWCRSTTVAVIDSNTEEELTRSAKDPVTGKWYKIPEDMTYAEWKKSVDEKHGDGTFDKMKKMYVNTKKDKEQYEKYIGVLGKENMPKTFDKFRDLKYNRVDEWENVKYYARNINGRPIEYVKIDRELEKAGIHKGIACIADDGIRAYILPDTDSKREPYHIMRRMKERNIADDEVRRFKDEAIIAMSQWNGKRIEYYSSDGVCIISKTSTNWVYKTAWKREDFDETTEKILEVCRKYVK